MKSSHILFLVVTVLLAGTVFIYDYIKPSRSVGGQNVASSHPGSINTVNITATEYTPDYETLARSRENPPYEFRGSGTSGKVVDRQGQVMMESGEDIGIFAVAVGPDKLHMLVKGGDTVNYILNPTTGLKLQLPVYPPGENMLGFGWHWLSETKLLGLSGVKLLNDKGESVSSCGGNNVAKTKLYVYDITSQKLTEVDLSGSIKHSVVTVVEVINDGHFHLVHEDPHGKENKDLGWFKIE